MDSNLYYYKLKSVWQLQAIRNSLKKSKIFEPLKSKLTKFRAKLIFKQKRRLFFLFFSFKRG